MKLKFVILFIFLFFVLGILGYSFWQKNIYSKEVLKLEILGPSEATLGEEIEYVVKYKNNGDITLEQPSLVFDYPAHSIVEGGSLRKEMNKDELEGDIYPGEEKSFKFKARLFGSEREAKEARVRLNYQPKNLKARYESETTLTTVLKENPLTFEFDMPSKVASGEEFTMRLNYFSKVDYPIPSLRAEIDYPQDFEFISSSPRSIEKTTWSMGTLNNKEGGRIEIKGRLTGDLGEQETFKARLGSLQDGDFIVLKEVSQGMDVIEPSLRLSSSINNSDEYVASPGETLHYAIFFKNIGTKIMENMFMVVKLQGAPFDLSSVKSTQGDFSAADNSIVFDWRKVPSLQSLDGQKEGSVSFDVNLKSDWGMSGDSDKNPTVKTTVTVSTIQKEFVTKVNSNISLSKTIVSENRVFSEGGKEMLITNSGPNPPKAGQETTYTLYFEVGNYYNDLGNAKVMLTLPSGVKLTGKTFPEDATLTYDSGSREMVWTIGSIEAGVGKTKPVRIAAIQIGFTPGSGQNTSIESILGTAILTAEDQFTGRTIQKTSN